MGTQTVITDAQIRELAAELEQAGDFDMQVLCLVALGEYGDDYVIAGHDFTIQTPAFRRWEGVDVNGARAECERVIREARAMAEDDEANDPGVGLREDG